MKTLINLTIKQCIFKHAFYNYAQGMLPIADKPIAAYCIDRLTEQGYETIYIITTNDTDRSSRNLGDGSFWCVQIHYLNIDTPIGLNTYTQLQEHGLQEVHLDKSLTQPTTQSTIHENSDCIKLFTSYLNDNINVMTNTNTYQLTSYQVRPNIFMSEGVKTRIVSDFPIHLGKYSQLKPRCICRGPVVIGRDAIVGSGTILDNTVIMPNTHIGSDLDLSNCLVTPQWIYHQMTKECIQIEEPQLLSYA